ncbi:MAG: sigma-70 family RNA polymerase sigma factor [Kiritimatiellae bacterium]|nr:sigma-70 family RNA polymerase sigma factor [Kiritimatiellia bacterium]
MDPREYGLLRRFVTQGDGDAFGLIVERYSAMVYSAARRRLGDHHLAEDAAQAAFLVLARKAPKLRQAVMLGSWLWRTTTLICRNMERVEVRRKRRETIVGAAAELTTSLRDEVQSAWALVLPYLDEALDSLSAKAREAVVARYLAGKSTREIAVELGVRENTVAVRINYGIQRLREFLAARGVRIGGGILLVSLGRYAAEAAPAGLPAAVCAAACGAGGMLGTGVSRLAEQALRTMLWAKVKMAAVWVAGTLAVAGACAPLVLMRHETPPPPRTTPPAVPAPPTEPAALHGAHPGDYLSSGGAKGTQQDIERACAHEALQGVRGQYEWRALEPREGRYDFSAIEADLRQLAAGRKRLWIHVKCGTSGADRRPPLPAYLTQDPKYGGSPTYRGAYERRFASGGWLPCIWNENVQARLQALYHALGARFSTEPWLEGVILPQTATGRPAKGYGYTVEGEQRAFMMLASTAQRAFPGKVVLQIIDSAAFDLAEYADWCARNRIGLLCYLYQSELEPGWTPNRGRQIVRQYRGTTLTAVEISWEAFMPAAGVAPPPERMLAMYRRAIEVADPTYCFMEWRSLDRGRVLLPLMHSRRAALARLPAQAERRAARPAD